MNVDGSCVWVAAHTIQSPEPLGESAHAACLGDEEFRVDISTHFEGSASRQPPSAVIEPFTGCPADISPRILFRAASASPLTGLPGQHHDVLLLQIARLPLDQAVLQAVPDFPRRSG